MTTSNKAMKLTRRGMEGERGAMVCRFRGCAVTRGRPQGARASQLIAGVRRLVWKWRGI
jgi:hypothetical protein